jgi:hypothetical protein
MGNASQQRNVASGLCRQGCGRPRVTKVYCRECLEKPKAPASKHVLGGLCKRGCGRPLQSKNHCRECLAKVNCQRTQHIANGLCGDGCGRKLVTKSSCQECTDKRRAKRHKLLPEHYRIARDACPNCQSCGVTMTEGTGAAGRCIDHDHVTGIRRGFLCRACNGALGLLYDDPVKIQALKDYIERCIARDAAP